MLCASCRGVCGEEQGVQRAPREDWERASTPVSVLCSCAAAQSATASFQ